MPARSAKQEQGQRWEQVAQSYLERRGLRPVAVNFRCKGGEIDLIMRDGATLVFVEVRQRADRRHGGALASIGPAKVKRLEHAATLYLMRFAHSPPCRFDVVAIDGRKIEWLRNAIEM